MPKATVASAPDEVAALLRAAADRGHLVILRTSPPQDDARTQFLLALNQLFGLTPAQSRALAALLEHNHVTRAEMHRAMARDNNPVSNIKTIDVIVGKMREKLRPFGVEVATIYGQGFRLAEGARDKINRLLAEYDAGLISTRPATAPAD